MPEAKGPSHHRATVELTSNLKVQLKEMDQRVARLLEGIDPPEALPPARSVTFADGLRTSAGAHEGVGMPALTGAPPPLMHKPRPDSADEVVLRGIEDVFCRYEDGPLPSLFGIKDCYRCMVLEEQVKALAQALAGLGAQIVGWATGMLKTQQSQLAELVLRYVQPCSHVDANLAELCADLRDARATAPAGDDVVAQHAESALWGKAALRRHRREARLMAAPTKKGATSGCRTVVANAKDKVLGFTLSDPCVTVEEVSKGGWAQRVHVKAGEELIAVDGVPVTKLSAEELVRRMHDIRPLTLMIAPADTEGEATGNESDAEVLE